MSVAAHQIGQDLEVLGNALLDDVMSILRSLPADALNWLPAGPAACALGS